MNKKVIKKIEIVGEGANSLSSILSFVNPVFAIIPIIVFSIKRVFGLISDEDIVKRIKKIEKQLKKDKISELEFKNKINSLTEHNRYIVSKNLNNILLNCIPETVDIYIKVWIDLIMNEKEDMHEEICEIICDLNKNDLTLLKMIKDFRNNGLKECFNRNVEHDKELNNKNKLIDIENEKTTGIKKIKFNDRSIRCNDKTIFWKDFCKTYELETPEMGAALIYMAKNDDGTETMDWAYTVRAFIKLNNLGILMSDYITTVGTSCNLNIDRFHLTLFGEKLLNYI